MKKVKTMLKLQLEAGKAVAGPPVGTALGPQGVNIMDFVKRFNEATADKPGQIIPVEISIFEDGTFDFVLKTPPAAFLIRQALGLDKGSATPNKKKVGTLTKDQVRQIAEQKMVDLNADDVEMAMRIIEGTAKSMGVEVK